jgi:hypothetical protein
VDAWLLRRFPGRTLDEIDGMNWPRYLRALEAERIEQVEDRRALYLAKKLKSEDLTPDDWTAIQQHDSWMADDG